MVILIFIVTFIFIAICGGILYLLYLPIQNRLNKTNKLTPIMNRKINMVYIFLVFLISSFITINSFFPSESFYKEEFKKVTLREIPKSAEFIVKSSSYPYFHGDYCSSSQIKLSKSDYKTLLNELKNDKNLSEINKKF